MEVLLIVVTFLMFDVTRVTPSVAMVDARNLFLSANQCFRMSPPTKRVSQKATPAACRLLPGKTIHTDDEESSGRYFFYAHSRLLFLIVLVVGGEGVGAVEYWMQCLAVCRECVHAVGLLGVVLDGVCHMEDLYCCVWRLAEVTILPKGPEVLNPNS